MKAAWAAEIIRRAADAEADPDDEEDWRLALDNVRCEVFPNRSKSVGKVLHNRITNLQRSRLAHECAKLDIREDEGFA